MKSPRVKPLTQKKRNTGLDGLRGIAALTVAFSHAGFFFSAQPRVSVGEQFNPLDALLRVFTAGGVGVQYLFVLCGFLMGYLYWDSKLTIWQFVKKRYLRIFPLYTAVVTYDMLRYKQVIPENNHIAAFLGLFAVLGIWHLVWTRIYKKQQSHLLATVTFGSFLTLQFVSAIANTGLSYFAFKNFTYTFVGTWFADVVTFTSNFFLTTPFLRVNTRLQGVFWSLAPEVLFYLAYAAVFWPFARRVLSGKKYMLVSLALFVSIIYALESPMWATLDFRSINILRWISFIGGMYLGWSMHKQHVLPVIERIAKHPVTTGVVGAGIPLSLLSGHYLWTQHSTLFFALYYGGITCIVLAAVAQVVLHPESLTSRILSHRFLVFVGTCSYSLYLIHEHILYSISPLFRPTTILANIPYILLITPVLLGCAYVSYWLVEKPYFQSKTR